MKTQNNIKHLNGSSKLLKKAEAEIISLIIVLIIFVLFIVSYLHQSQVDVEEFEICINNSNCLYNLIDETDNYLLCNKAKNISSCYFSIAFRYNNSEFCEFSQNELSCIISLSLNKSYNYCNLFYQGNEDLIRECNFNIDYYTSNSSSN